jgi:hypothetical protein
LITDSAKTATFPERWRPTPRIAQANASSAKGRSQASHVRWMQQQNSHSSGLPHGPQPGLAEKSIGMHETTELAVMCYTFHPLKLSKFDGAGLHPHL